MGRATRCLAESAPSIVDGFKRRQTLVLRPRFARHKAVVIAFERGAQWIGKDTLKKPLQALQAGASLLLFPEGNTGPKEGELLPLTRGIGHFVLRALEDCPILPIALSGVQELYWGKQITVIVGKPFLVSIEGLDHRAAIEAAVNQVTEALRSILPPYDEPVVAKKRLAFLTNLSEKL